jgi:4-amino-4-deoxy-L-arabinose transferase-like glycosyltransferase
VKLRYRLLFILILLSGSAVRLYRTTELGTQADEGVHIVIAERIATGEVLYRDLFENRTPGVEWLLAAVFRLAGPSLFWGRWLAVAMAAITIAALIAAGRLVLADHQLNSVSGGYVAGSLSGLLFTLAPLPIFWSRFTMLENFETAAAVLCITVALLGLVKNKMRYWLISGMLAGFAILAKQSGLLLLPVFGLYWLLQLAGSNWRSQSKRVFATELKPAGFWLLGCLLILTLMILALLLQGSQEQFFRLVSGSDRLRPFAGWPEKLYVLRDWMKSQPLSLLALAAAIVALRRGNRALQLLLLWVCAEVGALVLPPALDLSGGGLSHYALPTVAAASLLAGSGLVWEWGGSSLVSHRHRIALGGMLLLAAVTVPGWLDTLAYVIWESDYPQPDLAPEIAIGNALAAVTSDDQSILVLANGIFYHWAGRRADNRYFYYPSYLSGSSLASEAEADLLHALSNPNTGAVLATGLYLYHRLPPDIRDTLLQEWLSSHMPISKALFYFCPSPRTDPPSLNSYLLPKA